MNEFKFIYSFYLNLEERNLLSSPIVQLVQSTLTMGNHHGNWNTRKSPLYELHSLFTKELLIRIMLTKFDIGRPSHLNHLNRLISVVMLFLILTINNPYDHQEPRLGSEPTVERTQPT